LIPISQLVDFEEHIEPPFDLTSFLSSLSYFPIDVEPTSTKRKLNFDTHKPNPKIAKS
jgi:hypothetical protein